MENFLKMKNKAKKIMNEIERLDGPEKDLVLQYYQEKPERIYGVQQSLLKWHSDLPLFSTAASEQQTDLFSTPKASGRNLAKYIAEKLWLDGHDTSEWEMDLMLESLNDLNVGKEAIDFFLVNENAVYKIVQHFEETR